MLRGWGEDNNLIKKIKKEKQVNWKEAKEKIWEKNFFLVMPVTQSRPYICEASVPPQLETETKKAKGQKQAVLA